MSQSSRPTYTEDQIQKYLDYVGMKERISADACDTEAGLKYLNKLLPLQQAKVPFENLDLHYSSTHTVSIDPDYLFNKIVNRACGRGGYCFQNNGFFRTVLNSLGYKVMPCGARVSSAMGGESDPDKVTYGSWSHTVSIVYIEGSRYLVDVGFGSRCPSIAVPLVHDWTGHYHWKDYDDMRLVHTHIAANTIRRDEQKLWVYMFRAEPDSPWLPAFCFSEVEFMHSDFEAMNFYVSNSLTSFFTYTVITRRCLLDDQGQEIGEVTLYGGRIKETMYGKSEIVAELKNEAERVRALQKYFDIQLDASEVNGIKRYLTMLKD